MSTQYDINGVLTVETNIDLPIPSYYEVADRSGDADIRFHTGELAPFSSNGANRRIGSRYRWDAATETLYLEWNLPLDLRCSMTGLGDTDRATVVEMTSQYRKRGDVGSLFASVLNVELLARDHTILHGGGLARENGGALISGWDDMGKTSTCLSMHGRAGYSFMGDDAVILGADGTAHAWDRQVGISPYTATGNIPIPADKRRRIRLKRLAKKIPGLGVLHSSRERIDVEEVIGRERTSCEPTHAFFLEGGSGGPTEIEPGEGARRMLETSNSDKRMIKHDMVNTYSYLYPPISDPFEKRRSVFEGAMEHIDPVALRSEEKERYPDWISSYED